MVNVDFDSGIAIGYLLAEQGSVYALASTACCSMVTSEEVETQLHKMMEQVSWLKKWLLQWGLSFAYYLLLIVLGLGDHGFEVHLRHWELFYL